MKHLHLSIPALAAAALLAGCHSLHQGCDADARAGVERAKQAFFGAWTKAKGEPWDIARLTRIADQTDEFLSFDGMSPVSTVIQGWKPYAALWGPGMNQFGTASLTEAKALRTWVADDLAFTASLARIQADMPDGTRLDVLGHLTLGFEREDGEWRVVHEHMSLNVKE